MSRKNAELSTSSIVAREPRRPRVRAAGTSRRRLAAENGRCRRSRWRCPSPPHSRARPGRSLATSISSRCSTMSMISSTTRPMRAAMVGEHQDRLRALLLDAGLRVDAQQRHELVAILHEMAAVGDFDPAAIDLFKPRRRATAARPSAVASRRGTQASGVRSSLRLPRRHRAQSASARATGAARPSAWATPFGSMIMITVPSPRIVVPENSRDVPQLRRHRLDHDLLGVEHAVDDDAEDLAADLGDDDEACCSPSLSPSCSTSFR